jgi:hypothetical protein
LELFGSETVYDCPLGRTWSAKAGRGLSNNFVLYNTITLLDFSSGLIYKPSDPLSLLLVSSLIFRRKYLG